MGNNYAIILCAGSGSRMKADRNKIFMEIEGKTIVARVAEVFDKSPQVDNLIFVSKGDEILELDKMLREIGLVKPWKIVEGGKDRQSSVANAIAYIDEIGSLDDVVIIHDGARPFVKQETIISAIEALNEHDAVCVAVPTKDTLKIVNESLEVEYTPDRSRYWNIQTPQCFKMRQFKEAVKMAIDDGFVGTDDTSLVERLGGRVKIIMGSYDNIKITTKEDIAYARALLKMNIQEETE